MKIIVSGFGNDKPGIVKQISKIISDASGNIEESRMIRLGSDFTIMMLIDIHNDKDRVVDGLEGVEGMKFIIKDSSDDIDYSAPNATISLSGADNIGIVHLVSDKLAKNNINILEMNTDIVNMPNTGTPIFNMEARVVIDKETDLEELRIDLDRDSDEFDVEIELAIDH